MKLQPMNIRSSITRSAHDNRGNIIDRALDAGLIVCSISALLALLLFLDAYEYIVVPGGSKTKSQNQVSTPSAPVTAPVSVPTESVSIPVPGVPSVPESVPASVHSPTSTTSHGSDITQTMDSLQQEIEKAQRLIEQKRLELESLSTTQVETLAESEGVDDTALKANTSSNIEEEKEEVIEEIVEKELGIDEFCPECIWLETSAHTCEARLRWIKRHYKTEEDAGKKILLDQGCRKKGTDGRRRRLRR
ncbi:hypothetical protein HJC23_004162 [Cyclotella cryptica]|uniref:Uncharacterized protein n=1 Tax=Cyclotella cryptica TaxID=29204 RepID=A0ABD3P277_9STRA|eukprot:CCRYP_018986-RA/>CCRYP_018986-RA protein AED:0.38 eAED:0.38 QI:0/-1/0/1/-1/1/1/0/247